MALPPDNVPFKNRTQSEVLKGANEIFTRQKMANERRQTLLEQKRQNAAQSTMAVKDRLALAALKREQIELTERLRKQEAYQRSMENANRAVVIKERVNAAKSAISSTKLGNHSRSRTMSTPNLSIYAAPMRRNTTYAGNMGSRHSVMQTNEASRSATRYKRSESSVMRKQSLNQTEDEEVDKFIRAYRAETEQKKNPGARRFSINQNPYLSSSITFTKSNEPASQPRPHSKTISATTSRPPQTLMKPALKPPVLPTQSSHHATRERLGSKTQNDNGPFFQRRETMPMRRPQSEILPRKASVSTNNNNASKAVLTDAEKQALLEKEEKEYKAKLMLKRREAKEKEAREKEAREKEEQEREAREKEQERQAREKEEREKRAREIEQQEREAREKEEKEREAREKEEQERKAREKEEQEKEAQRKQQSEEKDRTKTENEKDDPEVPIAISEAVNSLNSLYASKSGATSAEENQTTQEEKEPVNQERIKELDEAILENKRKEEAERAERKAKLDQIMSRFRTATVTASVNLSKTTTDTGDDSSLQGKCSGDETSSEGMLNQGNRVMTFEDEEESLREHGNDVVQKHRADSEDEHL